MDNELPTRRIVLLAKNDMLEGMRVAAGLTIFGHQVSLVFMHRALTEEEANSEQAELLELADIVPQTTIVEMQDYFDLLDAASLGRVIEDAELVVNV